MGILNTGQVRERLLEYSRKHGIKEYEISLATVSSWMNAGVLPGAKQLYREWYMDSEDLEKALEEGLELPKVGRVRAFTEAEMERINELLEMADRGEILQRQIAKEMGCHESLISYIKSKKRYASTHTD